MNDPPNYRLSSVSLAHLTRCTRRLSFFQQVPHELAQRILTILKLRTFDNEQCVYHAGDDADSLSVIISGSIAIFEGTTANESSTVRRNTDAPTANLICTLGEGDCFGVQSFIDRSRRTDTAVCLDDAVIATLFRTDYDALMVEALFRHNQPRAAALKFIDNATPAPPSRRVSPNKKHSQLVERPFTNPPKLSHRLVQMLTAMMASPFFQQLSPDVKSLIAHSCEHQYVAARQPLYIEGDQADYAYFLLSGSCSEHVRTARSDPNETPQPTTRASTSAGTTTAVTTATSVAQNAFSSYTEREYSASRPRKSSISAPSSLSSSLTLPPSTTASSLTSQTQHLTISTSSSAGNLLVPPGSSHGSGAPSSPSPSAPIAARTSPQMLAPLGSSSSVSMGQPAAPRLLAPTSPNRVAVGTSKFGASPTLAIISEKHRGMLTPRSPGGGAHSVISSARSATSAATSMTNTTAHGGHYERPPRVLGPLPPPDSGISPPDVEQLFGRCVRVLAPPDFFGFDQPHFVPPPLPTTMTHAAASAAAVIASGLTSIMVHPPGSSHTRHSSVTSSHGTHTRRGSTASQPELRRPPVLSRQSSVITREPCRVLRVQFHWLADLLWRLASPLMPYWPLRLAVHAIPAARTAEQKSLLLQSLSQVKFFQTQKAEMPVKLCGIMNYLHLPAGSIVYKQGDIGVDRFFVLLSGSVSVHLAHKRKTIGGPVVPITPPHPPASSIYVADGTKIVPERGTIDHLESGEAITPVPPSRSLAIDTMLTSPAPGARALGASLFGPLPPAAASAAADSPDDTKHRLTIPKGGSPLTNGSNSTATNVIGTRGHSVASSSHHSHHRWSSTSTGGHGGASPPLSSNMTPSHGTKGPSSYSYNAPGTAGSSGSSATTTTTQPPRSAHARRSGGDLDDDEPKGYIVGGERLQDGVDIEGSYGPCMLVVSPGQSFGERTLTTIQPAATSVICRGDCEFMVIHKQDYARLLNRGVAGFVEDEDVPGIIEATHLASAFRNDDVLTQLDKSLSEVKFFQDMSLDMRRYLFEFMLHEHVTKDTIVFQEGDPGEHVFVILKGSISLHIRDKVAGRLHGFLQRARDKSKSAVLTSLKSRFSRAKDAVQSKEKNKNAANATNAGKSGRLLELPDGTQQHGDHDLPSPVSPGQLSPLADDDGNGGRSGRSAASPIPASQRSFKPGDGKRNTAGTSNNEGDDDDDEENEDEEDDEVDDSLRSDYKRSHATTPSTSRSNHSNGTSNGGDDDDGEGDDFIDEEYEGDDSDGSERDEKDPLFNSSGDATTPNTKRKSLHREKKQREARTEEEKKRVRRRNWNRRKHGGKQRERLTKKIGERVAAAAAAGTLPTLPITSPPASSGGDKPGLNRMKSKANLLKTPSTPHIRSPSAIAAADAQAAAEKLEKEQAAAKEKAEKEKAEKEKLEQEQNEEKRRNLTVNTASSPPLASNPAHAPRLSPLRSASGLISLAAPGTGAYDSLSGGDKKDGSSSPNLRLRRKTMKSGILKQLTDGAQLAAHEKALLASSPRNADGSPVSARNPTNSDSPISNSSAASDSTTVATATTTTGVSLSSDPTRSAAIATSSAIESRPTSSSAKSVGFAVSIVAPSEPASPTSKQSQGKTDGTSADTSVTVSMDEKEKALVDGMLSKMVARKRSASASAKKQAGGHRSTDSVASTTSTTSTTSVHQPLDLSAATGTTGTGTTGAAGGGSASGTTSGATSRPQSSHISRVVITEEDFPVITRSTSMQPQPSSAANKSPVPAASATPTPIPLVPASYHPAAFPSSSLDSLPPPSSWHPAAMMPPVLTHQRSLSSSSIPSSPILPTDRSSLLSPHIGGSSVRPGLTIVPSSPLLTPHSRTILPLASEPNSPALSPRSAPLSPRSGGIPLSPSGARSEARLMNKTPMTQSSQLKKAREERDAREKKEKLELERAQKVIADAEEKQRLDKEAAEKLARGEMDEKAADGTTAVGAADGGGSKRESKSDKWPMMMKVHPPGHRGHHKSRGHIDIDTMYGPCIDVLGVGHAFGEIAVMAGGPRTATIITREDTDFLLIPREAFLKTVRVKKSYSTRDKHLELMNKSPWFARWTNATLLALSYHVEERRFTRNEVIIQQGDPDHTTFFLISGTCRVSQRLRLLPVKRPRRAPSTLEVALLEAKMKGRPPPTVATAQSFEQFFHGTERSSSVMASTAASLSRSTSGFDSGSAERHHALAHSELQAIRAGLGLPLEESFEVTAQELGQKSCSVRVYCRNPSSVQQALAPTQAKQKKMSVHTTDGVALPKLKTLEVELGILGDREQFGGSALLLAKGKVDETLDEEAIQLRMAAVEAKDKAERQAVRASIDGPAPGATAPTNNNNIPGFIPTSGANERAPPAVATVMATSDVRILAVRTMALKHFMPKKALARLKKTVTHVGEVHHERMERCLEVRVVAAVRRIEEEEASMAAGATASAALNSGTIYRGVSTSLSVPLDGSYDDEQAAPTIPSTSAYHVLHSAAISSNAAASDANQMMKTRPDTPPIGEIHVPGMSAEEESTAAVTSNGTMSSAKIAAAQQSQHAELRRLRQDALATGARWTKQLGNLLDTGFEAKAEELKENARSALRVLAEQHLDETMNNDEHHTASAPTKPIPTMLSAQLQSYLGPDIDPSTARQVTAVLNGGPGGTWANEFNEVHRVFGITPVDTSKLTVAPRLATTATARESRVSKPTHEHETKHVTSRIHGTAERRPPTHQGPPFPGALLHFEDRPVQPPPGTAAGRPTTTTATARYNASRAMARDIATGNGSPSSTDRKQMSRTAPITSTLSKTQQSALHGGNRPVTSSGATADPTQFRAQIMAKVLTAGSGSVVDDLARLHRYLPPPSPVWVQFAQYVPALVASDEDQQMESVRRGWHKHRSTPIGPPEPVAAHAAGVLPVNDGQASRNLGLNYIPKRRGGGRAGGSPTDSLARQQQQQQRVVQQSMSLPELRSARKAK